MNIVQCQAIHPPSVDTGACCGGVDEEDRLLKAPRGVSDPERKRKLIGNRIIDLFEEEAASWRMSPFNPSPD